MASPSLFDPSHPTRRLVRHRLPGITPAAVNRDQKLSGNVAGVHLPTVGGVPSASSATTAAMEPAIAPTVPRVTTAATKPSTAKKPSTSKARANWEPLCESPVGPRNPKTSPERTARSMPSTAVTAP